MFQALRNRLRVFNRIRKSAYRGESELRLIQHLINRGTAIDVGANKGVYSLVMSRYADRVIAIEPNKDLHEQLSALPANCEVIYSAVGEKHSQETLYIPIGNKGQNRPNVASLIDDDQDGAETEKREVEVRVLNEIAQSAEDVQLIKIDVEGTELDVLKGSEEILKKHKPVLIVECLSDEDEATITDYLSAFGYQPFRYVEQRLQHASQVVSQGRGIDRNVLYFPCT